MASCIKRKIYAYKSDDTTCVYGAAVKFGSDSKHVTKSAAKTDKHMGICQTEAGQVKAVGDPVEVARPGGGAMALLNGVVSAGDELAFDGTGFVTAGSTDWVMAHADAPGVAGDIIPVVVEPGHIKA